MVAGNSPEKLPPGWKEHIKVTNGRTIKYYTNAATGKKFYSKKAVIRYDNAENDCNGTPQPRIMRGKEGSEGKADSGGAETNESAAWLPRGWITEVRARKSGSQSGKTYKIYTDPSTGSKFFSKLEVSRYLETLDQSKNNDPMTKNTAVGKSSLKKDVSENQKLSKGHSGISKKEKDSSSKPSTEIVCSDVVESSSLDGLPVGWITEYKTRKYAHGIKRDPYYTDPVSGYVFRSKKDVWRYLETGDIRKCAMRPKKRDDNDSESSKNVNSNTPIEVSFLKDDTSEQHVLMNGKSSISKKKRNSISKHSTEIVLSDVVATPSVDELPLGWIKEIKTTRNARGIRRDAFYTDPVSGYIFRSKRDALRYIETGDINKCSSKPKKRDANDPESTKDVSLPSPPVDKRYSLRSSGGQLAIGEKLNDGKENCATSSSTALKSETSKRKKVDSVSADAVVTESVTEVPEKKQPFRRERKSRKTAQSSEPESKGSKQEIVSADDRAFSNAGTDHLHGQKLPKNMSKQKINRKNPMDLKESKKRIAETFPGRTSKRLAGGQPEMPNLQLSERSLRAAMKSCEGEVDILSIITMNSAANGVSQPFNSELASGNAARRFGEGECDISPVTTTTAVAEGIPQPLGTEPAPGVADIVSMVVESISKIEESDKSEEPSAEDHAVPEEKTGGQVNEKQDYVNPTQGTYQFLDSWSDPCLDFAFKTLTGALPVDNTLSYQGSSQHQNDTSYIQRNEYFQQSQSQRPGLFQNGIPSHSNSVGQHVRVEQLPRGPTSLPFGNFSLPTFGSFGSQQHARVEQSPRSQTSLPPGNFCLPIFGGIGSQQHARVEQLPRSQTSLPPGNFSLPTFGGNVSQQPSSEARNNYQRNTNYK